MIFSHFTLSQQVLSESCTFCAITGKRKFAFSTVASFSRQKPLKSKNKNDTIVWNKKFYHCAKFELYRIKDAKVFPSMQLRALSWPGVLWLLCEYGFHPRGNSGRKSSSNFEHSRKQVTVLVECICLHRKVLLVTVFVCCFACIQS